MEEILYLQSKLSHLLIFSNIYPSIGTFRFQKLEVFSNVVAKEA